jgi:hypothetical protein
MLNAVHAARRAAAASSTVAAQLQRGRLLQLLATRYGLRYGGVPTIRRRYSAAT